jgi:ABC-2 type transport system permease protein
MAISVDARATAQTRLRWELLVGLVSKDLKVKYKDSSLGFAWSMANPLLLLAVYYFVFAVVLPNSVPGFVVYLMAGLLIWQFFASSVTTAVGSVTANANLVKKVRFPLLVLPLSAVGFAGVHFALQSAVFVVLLVLFGFPLLGVKLLLLVPAMAVALTFTAAVSILVSAVNVRYRDVQHILEVVMLAWFWINPIVYPAGLVAARLGGTDGWLYRLYFLNPPGIVSATFQRALYDRTYLPSGAAVRGGLRAGANELIVASPHYSFYLQQLAMCLAGSLLLFWLAMRVFRRLSGDFAEQL